MRCYIDGTGIYGNAASASATTFTSKSLFMGTTPGFRAAVELNQPVATLEQTSAQLLAGQSQQPQAQQEQQKVAMGGRRSFNACGNKDAGPDIGRRLCFRMRRGSKDTIAQADRRSTASARGDGTPQRPPALAQRCSAPLLGNHCIARMLGRSVQ
ncbi:hypothetical protein [Xanthomonas vasicola]|nr:hypothetical protein [Xanthomonas vasicola]KFA26875.1 hypothetical protein KWG_0123010 [Xanthomonas vasicola pv. vasculorum NCPPB 1381]KFA28365.1 hypothetical protein KW5_0110300 [Xanthomonas vasicola pv. vasculorum NCPPB 1326]